MRAVLLSIAVFAASALCESISSRDKLIGSWQPDGSAKGQGAWTLQNKDPNAIRITYSLGDQNVSEIECGTMGRECAGTDSGKPAKVSMWFNGDTLVEIETKGQEVTKRRFAVKEPDDTLEIETIPISPQGKTETMHFRRVAR